MRWLLAFLAWLTTTALLLPLCFFVVMVLAGPHSSALPGALQPIVLAAGWLMVLVTPLLVARQVYRRRTPAAGHPG